MTGVGRTCADTIKRSRHNVAIATQVLSPSAIGGSLRGQRRLKHFGPPDDDEEEFISYRRRAAWKKLGSYGVAIFAVILLLLGKMRLCFEFSIMQAFKMSLKFFLINFQEPFLP